MDKKHPIVVFFMVWTSLLWRVAPHVTAGDSAELALAGSTLGIAHSPGYPLFVLFNKLLSSLFYFGNEAYRQNLCSLFLMAASAALLGWVLVRFTGKWALAYLPLILLFSPVFRHAAAVAEVFPLTFFWASLILAATSVLFAKPKGLIFLSFLFGLGIAVHQTLVLLYPAVLLFVIASRRKTAPLSPAEIAWSVGFFILGLSVNLFIWIRSFGNPILDWEDPETWGRFWGVLTRERYGFFQLAQGDVSRSFSFESIGTALDYARNKLISSAGWIGALLLALGTITSLARDTHRRFVLSMWLFILCSGPFFFWMSGSSLLEAQSEVMNRFLLLPLAGVALVIGLGISIIWDTKISLYRWTVAGLIAFMFVEGVIRCPSPAHAAPLVHKQHPPLEKGESYRWDWSLREAGLNALRHLPPNSILISDRADEFEFVTAFLLGAEGRRDDIQFIDANAGVTRSMYGDDYYRIWGPARIERREKIEGELVASSDRPVFYATVDPAMVNIYRTDWGMLVRAVRLERFRPPPIFSGGNVFTWRFDPVDNRADRVLLSFLDALGRFRFDQKNIDGALAAFGLARRFGGTNRFEQIGFLYQMRRRNWEAARYYQKAVDAGVQTPSLYSNLGLLESARGRRSEAIALYKRGLKFHPNSVPLLYNLSVVYWHQNKWAEVVNLLGRILEIDPKHQEAAWRYPKAKSLERFSELQARRPKPVPKPQAPKPQEPTPEPESESETETEAGSESVIEGDSGHGDETE